MGAGTHGGFGDTKGARGNNLPQNEIDHKENNNEVSLPTGDSQIRHIFGKRDGHLPDTEANRKLLTDLANDKTKYVGKDKYGNSWNVETLPDGQQNWVRYQNGKINEGGRNNSPKKWNSETGLNNNPKRRPKGGKK